MVVSTVASDANSLIAQSVAMESDWGGNLRLRRVLCPVDLSEVSERALRLAARIASHYDARLFVQHTFPQIDGRETRRVGDSLPVEELPAELQFKELEVRQLVERAGADRCHLSLIMNDGAPRERILETISAKAIDLMVIGTQGRRGLQRLVQGSLTERVIHQASCPSLVINRRGALAAPHRKFDPLHLKTILVATDFSSNSMRLIIYALRWAWGPSSRVILLHSVETAPPALGKLSDLLPEYGADVEQRLREASGRMRALIPFPNRLPYQIDFEVRDGDPKEQILRVARENRADLIIMGARILANPAAVWGSTIAGVLRHGRYPVLAVRHLGE
ncbi:MAG: universal stress protein [Acidobacteria bacterium]|nr:universal stress protein [Acidobacteriota bacterium]